MTMLKVFQTICCHRALPLVLATCLLSVSAQATANDDTEKQQAVKPASNKPVVIQSQVTGSQEQPKVLYIMPWQGINNPIDINNEGMRLTLPEFRPINPKVFRQQVRDFANGTPENNQ
ncbi:hypothetical protein H5125_06790 [Shewanella sp. SR44-4]|uniref:hypothetical protein n=1 Tax=unclassified Shewanella TaxID=196818 RepID=UPI0016042F7D|nr:MULTISPECIES: hypothetical protein [unclassified Shewanella]MBB1361855.1 hypothetical protein [Shewanella sp. SR44-4]MBO1894782.1 hypothetical protein [Shewanella sp. BF02_Schw]